MMRMLRSVVFVVTIVIGALTSSWRSARANPVDLYGFGSRQIALAGAVGATVDDASANYYNPGGLVRGSDLRIDIGYRYAHPFLALNGQPSYVDAARGCLGKRLRCMAEARREAQRGQGAGQAEIEGFHGIASFPGS